MRKFRAFFSVVALVLLAAKLGASAEGAKAAYTRGITREKIGDYAGAIQEYQLALVESPRYVYANKQMGTCYYHLGEKAEALRQYEIYLAVVPNDPPVQKLAASLRASSTTAPAAIGLHPGFYIGFSSDSLSNHSAEFQSYYGSYFASSSDSAIYGDIYLGYSFPFGYGLEAGFESLSRISTVTYVVGNFGYQDQYSFRETAFYAEPLYRWPFSPRAALVGGLKLGYAAMTMNNGVFDFKSSGPIYAPDLRFQYLFGGRWSVELGAEYRVAEFSPVKNYKGQDISYTDSNGAVKKWYVSDTGPAFRLGINIYFDAFGY